MRHLAALALLLLALTGGLARAEERSVVVLLHGALSGPEVWRGSEALLAEAGFDTLNLRWRPEAGQGLAEVADEQVAPAIEAALLDRGWQGRPLHFVTHSTGGLVARHLVEGGWALADQVESLAMISAPHHGPHTGVAALGCASVRGDWRQIVCDLRPGSAFLASLGLRKPEAVRARYLNIGVAAPAPYFWALYDGDGDGRPRGHDNVVAVEAAWMPDVPFIVWRAWSQADHFHVTCAREVNAAIIEFLRGGEAELPARRVRGTDACVGIDQEISPAPRR